MVKNNEIDPSQPLKSSRQELFVQKYTQGMSASEAYRQAGYKPDYAEKNATRLTGNDGISARIRYLQAEKAVKAGITQEGQARKLEIVQNICLANGEHSTYVKAVQDESRLFGLDKQVIEQSDAQRQLTETQAAEALRIAEIRVREVAALESSKVAQSGTEGPEYAVVWTDDPAEKGADSDSG